MGQGQLVLRLTKHGATLPERGPGVNRLANTDKLWYGCRSSVLRTTV
jgi:hypothetical protein